MVKSLINKLNILHYQESATMVQMIQNIIHITLAITLLTSLNTYASQSPLSRSTNQSPLHESASSDQFSDIQQALTMHAADINTPNAEGETPLHIAAYSGCHQTVNALITKKVDIEIPDAHGNTPLMIAAAAPINAKFENANFKKVQRLITAKANVLHTNRHGLTALQSGRGDITQTLILQAAMQQHGAPIPIRELYPLVTQNQIPSANSAMHHAIQEGDLKTIQELVRNASTSKRVLNIKHGCCTPLTGAILEDKSDIIEFLLQQPNTDTRLYVKEDVKETPHLRTIYFPTVLYHVAAQSPLLLERLQKMGAANRLKDIQEQLTAGKKMDLRRIHYAVADGDYDLLQLLLEHKQTLARNGTFDINTGYYDAVGGRLFGGRSPLTLAVDKGNSGMVDLLLAHGAKVWFDHAKGTGARPSLLLHAAANGDLQILKKLAHAHLQQADGAEPKVYAEQEILNHLQQYWERYPELPRDKLLAITVAQGNHYKLDELLTLGAPISKEAIDLAAILLLRTPQLHILRKLVQTKETTWGLHITKGAVWQEREALL